MSMQAEWKDRIRLWKDELKKLFYLPIEEIDFEGFVTREQLSLEAAAQRPGSPFGKGAQWGEAFEYGWFFGRFIVPEAAAGKKLVLNMGFGTEGTVYVDGRVFGTYRADWVRYPHQYMCDLVLTGEAVAGQIYDIAFEAYAGHGERLIMTGPLSQNRPACADVTGSQAIVGTTTVGEWCETAYQLYLDLSVLIDIRNNTDETSLRVQRIDKALKQFTNQVDYEQKREYILEDLDKVSEAIQPLMECVNGSTVPQMYAFGHSHLDVAWLWPIDETKRKCARTFSTQLKLMEMYPEYKFLQSQPYLYEQTKLLYPELYQNIKEKVEDGQFIPEGGMWLEADTNITGGESLIRQFLYGKDFFRKEFGIESRLLWLPDVFGYSGALPQIMKGCGVEYFSTQKILHPYNDHDPFPYNYFMWKGIDGSEVTAFIHEDYTADTKAKNVILRWKERRQKEDNEAFLYPFGYGDGGAGPTRDHLEYARRLKNLEGVPKVRMASPLEFFDGMEQMGNKPAHTYHGEIYFSAHRGVYTSQARTKKGNRRGEFALREAEIWSVFKNNRGCENRLKDLYKILLLNQFHDILPGSSIACVYEKAENDYAMLLAQADEIIDETLDGRDPSEDCICVYNSLSWNRTADIYLPESWNGAVSSDGKKLLCQPANGKLKVRVEIPSMGYTTLFRSDALPEAETPFVSEEENGVWFLENDFIRARVNCYGELESVWDKELSVEWLAGRANRLCMYRDVPRIFDAWDIDSMYEENPVDLENEAKIEAVASGSLYQSVRVRRKINDSEWVQEIRLNSDCRQIDFITEVDWRERHKLLKVNFPLNIQTDEMYNEIQFGYIKRPMHQSRQYDADRFEVCQQKWSAMVENGRGGALLNDCKYGISGREHSLNLTLLKAGKAPDAHADMGRHTMTYSLYLWKGAFMDSGVVNKAYELNTKVRIAGGNHGTGSFMTVDKKNIVVEAVKYAYDRSPDIILRLYESGNTWTRASLKINDDKWDIYETDMLENIKCKNAHESNQSILEFSAFEIKTLRLRRSREQ